jgi:hypothetical protein
MSMHSMGDLAGTLRIAPGQPRPHGLVSSRRDWAAVLTKGMPAIGLAARLASVYSLCGESHRLCATMAVAAAQGNTNFDTHHAVQALQHETLREHVRRMGLDWPTLLLAEADDAALTQQAHTLLRQCPLVNTTAVKPFCADVDGARLGLQDWLQEQLLGISAATWLVHWDQDPAGWLRTWSASTPLCVPRLLNRVRPRMDMAAPGAAFLRVHDSDAGLRALVDDLLCNPGFSRQPLWRGGCAETGCWTRLHQTHAGRITTPWLRLGARVAELVRLALPDAPQRSGAQWLAMGSLATVPQAGLAWVEMARGLLIHHVQLDATGATVLACQVVAPTEWNFHPQGAVAQAIEALPPDASLDVQRRVNALISAYDPCVTHELMEPAHA